MVSKSTASTRQRTRIYHTSRAIIASSDETQQRIAPATHHTSRPQQAGGACLECGLRANPVVLKKMLIKAPGNLLCFAVELGFYLRDLPTPFTTTTVATGPATVEYKQHRVSTAHVAPVPR